MKQWFFSLLTSTIVLTIALIAWYGLNEDLPLDPEQQTQEPSELHPSPMASGHASTAGIVELEAKLETLNERVANLESQLLAQVDADAVDPDSTGFQAVQSGPGAATTVTIGPAGTVNAAGAAGPTMQENLVTAGVDPIKAEDVVRRQAEFELARLNLRDKAVREGYLRTPRYREEARELMEQQVSLQDELDLDVYDQFLWQTGSPNRISVGSVMMGSAAETAGLQPGDVVVSYGDKPIYSGGDLRRNTTAGERGEYVNVTVQRNGTEFTVSVPRGPLGVRVLPTRVDPAG